MFKISPSASYQTYSPLIYPFSTSMLSVVKSIMVNKLSYWYYLYSMRQFLQFRYNISVKQFLQYRYIFVRQFLQFRCNICKAIKV